MGNDLYKASSIGSRERPGYLVAAWYELYRKSNRMKRKTTHGIDGQTIENFKSNLVSNLKGASNEMRSLNGYCFSELRPVFLEKSSGKYRLICIPTVRDRVVQKSIQDVLQKRPKWKYCKFNGVNYGFVKNQSVQNAVKKTVKLRNRHPYCYKTDISAFFDNIDREQLKEEVRGKVPNSSLHKILFRAIDCEITDAEGTNQRYLQKAGIQPKRGVRQGMPLSPLFANLYLCDFDIIIQKNNLHGVRYADDIIFFADSVTECKDIDSFCRDCLSSQGLQIPPISDYSGKTQIARPDEPIEFLGISINPDEDTGYHAKIPDDQYKAVRNAILQFSDLDYLSSQQITLRNYAQKLTSKITGYEAAYVDCIDIQDFSNRLEQWQQKALRILLSRQFDIKYDQLTAKKKRFLDVSSI
jgi:RNA-directed DNA polymerase